MASPSSVTELQRFLGMVNYVGSFIKNLSQEISHMRQLLSKQNEGVWTHKYELEFNNVKKLISSSPVLTYYNPNKEITLSVDASKDALESVISHEKQPIAFASASLTSYWQYYLGVPTKFHQYIYGMKITVETDHKPLITLFKKALFDIPPRLQRIILRLQPYDLKVVYKPGSYLYVADKAVETRPCVIKTDASNYALGAVLVQGEGENEHPEEYASRLL